MSMTQDFLDGFLLAMMPPMIPVARLVWKANPAVSAVWTGD
jgi:hypothetical protein